MAHTTTLKGKPNDPIKKFENHQQVKVDFDRLARSGELSDSDIGILRDGYPKAAIVFMGLTTAIPGVPGRFCLGIRTGDVVHPKNMFLISPALAYEAVDPNPAA